MPKVSVIIPTYNAMTYLSETVESVLRQTYPDFELLIIDDGSSDQTVQWISQLVDSRVRLIPQTNQGVAVARNTGIAKAQGEYVAFLDHDDLWEPTKLEKQVRYLEDNPAVGLVHTWMVLVDQCGKSTGRVISSNAEGDVWKQLLERNTIASSSVMVRRCCFETVGVFSPSRDLYTVEDWEMWVRIASRYPFAVIKKPLLSWRQHANNGSKNWRAMEQAYALVIEKAFDSAPSELLYLKQRSYGHANLCLAWRVLQSSDKDYNKAIQFRQLALSYYPQLRYSGEYIRLSLAIALMQWLGSDTYTKVLAVVYALRRRISNAAQ
jgi:glycosyltransferase involved in cell wall biosynthesis